jgi:hypothetical protein|uniref:Uncharacterized protein n=1 Tax=Picea glauca TaxID=3330 RepID=A0A101LUQ5_PICGL|nr:hypothetical protein ABT39_MTgene2544 [Picea glauca]QHR89091.1 hypothetical protein Q903MT_gene3110 [Picea sitchensis]
MEMVGNEDLGSLQAIDHLALGIGRFISSGPTSPFSARSDYYTIADAPTPETAVSL